MAELARVSPNTAYHWLMTTLLPLLEKLELGVNLGVNLRINIRVSLYAHFWDLTAPHWGLFVTI